MNNNLPVLPDENKTPTPETKAPKKKSLTKVVLIVVAIQLVLAILAGSFLFKRGYQIAKDSTAGKIREGAYNTVYDATEQAYHTSNRVSISLTGLQETADLEVLKIDTSYTYISDDEDKSRAQTIWYKIPGIGTYTVDMKKTEFIVDAERQIVIVNAPYPAITQFKEDYDNIRKLYFRDDRFLDNGSIIEGENIARKMLVTAHVEMMKSLESNQAYNQAAEESARKLITNIIKALNPTMENLTVTVNFSDGSAS